MTYVSHTVRSLRRDPIPGETVGLVLTLDDDARIDDVRDVVESVGGEVVRELQLGRLLVRVGHERLGEICELDGVTTVETDAVLDYSG
ncbi:hypothetical protein [Halorussus amylolyticus]|uniref:hypothetical protein n=1 Tax=Halorussus amylolyticus TaxID=1126242 RepID=UPI00104FD627|nr:hypothetical protein [Halorussus amylolyticus]